MFTGLVQNLGTVLETQSVDAGLEILIHSDLKEEFFQLGSSIAVNGVCLTVEHFFPEKQNFLVTAVPETLKISTLGRLKAKDQVNLEPAATLSTAMGGHLVSGHVDGVGMVLQTGSDLRIQVPSDLLRFFPVKGSVVVNGVSLTIADIDKDQLRIALIPETLESTNLGTLRKGAGVNLEVDLIARYLDRLLTFRS